MPEKKDKVSNVRNYKVLRAREKADGDAAADYGLSWWQEMATLEASSGEQAIRLVAAENGAGHYVAVPVGNWSEMILLVEQQAPKITVQKVEQKKAAPAAGVAA